MRVTCTGSIYCHFVFNSKFVKENLLQTVLTIKYLVNN